MIIVLSALFFVSCKNTNQNIPDNQKTKIEETEELIEDANADDPNSIERAKASFEALRLQEQRSVKNYTKLFYLTTQAITYDLYKANYRHIPAYIFDAQLLDFQYSPFMKNYRIAKTKDDVALLIPFLQIDEEITIDPMGFVTKKALVGVVITLGISLDDQEVTLNLTDEGELSILHTSITHNEVGLGVNDYYILIVVFDTELDLKIKEMTYKTVYKNSN